MDDQWTSELGWDPHQRGLARWAAHRWGWKATDPDWPSALALLVCAEDEGNTALLWDDAPNLWERRFAGDEQGVPFGLPGPDQWPEPLWREGWFLRTSTPRGDLIQSAKNADLEARLFRRLIALVDPEATPGVGQDEAVARAGQTRLLLLAGGPGTGKTTTLKRMVAAWSEQNPGLRTVIAAPTGRAAARARESFRGAAGAPECLTLHRLLGLRPGLSDPWHGPHRPLPFDLVVVDEASMLDLRTATSLAEALAPGSALVLVGDPGQLPSVDAGSVLADLLSHKAFAGSVVRLVERFRLDRGSQSLARAFDLFGVPAERPNEVVTMLRALSAGSTGDFRWLETGPDEDPGPQALAAWGSPRDLAIGGLESRILLSPVHQGAGGTEALAALIDRALGRPVGTIAEGTPWMVGRNLPHLGLHNGDRGLVIRRDGKLWFTSPDQPDRQWPFSLVAEDGKQAWAVTVHKSQGSEFDRVVLVLPPRDSPGIVRELVYTALTRAKTAAVIVGSAASLERALARGTSRTSGWALRV